MLQISKSCFVKAVCLPALFFIFMVGVGGNFGCAAAAVGAAGASGGVAYTDRGAKADVKGDVQNVNQQTKSALDQMGIQVTGSEMKDSCRAQAADNTTHVEVVARESPIKWNKDYAKEILAKIVNQG